MARIRCVRGPSPGAQHSLGFVASLGSENGNSIILQGDAILPRHADIRVRTGKYCLVSASPKAFVALNGKRITEETELKNGDLIVIGSQEWLFENTSTRPTSSSQIPVFHPPSVETATPPPGPIDPKVRIQGYGDMMEALEAFKQSEKLQAYMSTMYKVAALISATLSPATLRERLFDALSETLQPDRMFLVLLDGSPKPRVAAQRVKEALLLRGVTQISQSIVSHVTRTREAVLVESSQDDERFSSKRSIVTQNVGSCVAAPLMSQGKVLGVLYADRIFLKPPFEPFRDDDLKLLSAIAAQFSAAYQNALLYEQSVEFGKKLSSLNEAARQISSSLDLDRIARSVSDCTTRILECDDCFVLLGEPAGTLRVGVGDTSVKPHDEKAFRENTAVAGLDRSLSIPIPAVENGKPAGVIRVASRRDNRPFDESDQKLLGIIALQASTSIRNASLELGQKLHHHELSIAAKIQTRLLPKRLPELTGFGIAAHYQPKEAVGGDYYDLIEIDADRLGVVVADVCGKGVPASIIMAELRTFLQVMAPAVASPRDLMARLNRKLHEDLPRDMFVTALYGITNRRDRSFTFVSCGHNPLVMWHQGENKVKTPPKSGMALGPVVNEPFDSQLHQFRVDLAVGDRLVLYSDGLVEAMNPRDQMYEGRFQEFVKASSALPSAEFLASLLKDLEAFREGREQPDDLTVVTLRVNALDAPA